MCSHYDALLRSVLSHLCNLQQLQQYQFYSVGLLSSQDHYREAHRHGMGSRAKRLKDERKMKGLHFYIEKQSTLWLQINKAGDKMSFLVYNMQ